MSTLISSAVGGGKKAAPKAVGRRRPPPPTAKATPIVAVSTEDQVNAPESPPFAPIESDNLESTSGRREPSPLVSQSPDQPVDVTLIVASEPSIPRRINPRPPEAVTQDTEPPLRRSSEVPVNAKDDVPGAANVDIAVTEKTARIPSKKRLREEATGDEGTTSAKRTRTAGSVRRDARIDADSIVQAGQSTPPATSQASRQRTSDDCTVESSTQSLQHTSRRQTKGPQVPTTTRATRSSAARTTSVENAVVENSGNVNQDRLDDSVTTQPESQPSQPTRKPRRRGRVRGTTAPDGVTNDANSNSEGEQQNSNAQNDRENHEIDPSTLSMYEISRDTKNGKISEREKKMAEIDWDEVARKRREHDDEAAANLQAKKKVVVESTEPSDNVVVAPPEDTTPTAPGGSGVKFRIVDNLIVVDETTTTIDRQARAEAEAQTSGPVQEETDLTARINRTTWINDRRRDLADRVPMYRNKSDPWSFEETERLYQAIAMFGTDYFTIAQMFPPKTRKQIKLKVQREEKLDPKRINAAFMGTHTPMNLEFYAQATGRDLSDFTKYGNLEQAASRIADDMKDKEEAMHAALAHEAENEKNREAFEKEQARVKGSRKKSSGERKTKKKMHSGGTMGGGVPVEAVAETIEKDS